MGKVYLAQHPAIGRRTAIKVLHPNLAGDPAAVSRFFAEARASNAIRHPNIVEIFDSGTLDTGAPYIIMEHLEGETLAARMVAGLALGRALDFACQAASALAAAHAQQIVHRDLKPENLFVVPDPRVPGRELVKVLDFGVAKLAERLEEPAYRTRSGSLVGTPRYMSPEQCLGETQIDARSDIYSLGGTPPSRRRWRRSSCARWPRSPPTASPTWPPS
jgi:eukaryotic-like serine/threonine-protein kinase